MSSFKSPMRLNEPRNLLAHVNQLEQRLQKLEYKLDILSYDTSKLDMRMISIVVSQYYSVSLDRMLSKSKEMEYTRPRQVTMYLSRKLLNYSYATIARFFERDASAIQHAVKIIESIRAQDSQANLAVESLMKRLKNQQKLHKELTQISPKA